MSDLGPDILALSSETEEEPVGHPDKYVLLTRKDGEWVYEIRQAGTDEVIKEAGAWPTAAEATDAINDNPEVQNLPVVFQPEGLL